MPVASKKNKKKVNNSSNNTVSTPVQNTVKSEPVILPNNGKPKLFILFYTTYLHIYKMALEIKKGAEKQGKCDVYLYQIPETLSKEALKKVRAPPKPNVPYITTDLLRQADGILFGFPTRYGILPAQLKDFIDSCGQLWAKGELAGKMAGTFVSTATQHGGQETSILTFLTTLAHFGIIYVPFGYSSPHLNNDTEILGGSPWGSSVIAGKDGTRQPSELELEIANLQGENFSKTLARYNLKLTLQNEKSKESLVAGGDLKNFNDSNLDNNSSNPNTEVSPLSKDSNMNIKLDNVPVSSDKESSGIQTKLGLASGAVAAGILASDAVSTKARENNVQNSTSILESHFDDNIMAIPADMDSTRGVVDQQVQYNNLQSEGSLENNPLLTSKENYLDSVATSDASGLLLQNSKGREHDTIPNDDTATMPIITTRNEVKDESNMTSSQAVLSMDTDSTGAHYQQGPLVLTETQPLTLNLDKSSHLTSTIDSSGDLKAIPTETLGSDNIVLGPGGNAGDGSTINSSYPANDNIGEKSRGNMPNKLESGMALASTASVVGATAAVASSRNDNSNVEPPNELNHATEESLNKMYSEGYKGVETSNDVTHRNVNRTLVQGIPIESEVAGAASSTSGQIVDFKALSEKQSSLIIPIKQKDTLGPLKMDKNDSKKSTTSSNNTGEKQDSRRSSSILASAALTAASAVAAGIFANKGVKKSKEKKAEKMNQLNDSVAADMHESALPVTNEYNKDNLVVEPTPPVTGTLASDPKATEADIPKVVVTPTLNDKGVDRVSGQNMSTGNAPSPDIDARGKNVSQAFNLNDSIAPALGSTAGVAAATATTGAVLSHDVNHTNGSSGAIVNTQSKESDTQPRIGHDVQTKKSFGTGIPEIPVPVTATQASSQNPGYSSVKEKESYDNKTTRSKNSSLAKDKSSTSSLKKLFNRLSFRKKDPFVDTDDDM